MHRYVDPSEPMSEMITVEKALKIIDDFRTAEISRTNAALVLAQAALTKESAQKPLERKRVGKKGIDKIYRCPCPGCDEAHGHVFTDAETDRKIRRCPECGQRLEWSDDDSADDWHAERHYPPAVTDYRRAGGGAPATHRRGRYAVP